MLDTWLLTPAQKLAQKAFRDAVDEYGEPACRQEPEMFEDRLPDEVAGSGAGQERKDLILSWRKARIEYAQRKCNDCPLFAECEDVKLSDGSIMGVIAGDLRTDHPIEDRKTA